MCNFIMKKAGGNTKQRTELSVHTKMSDAGSVISAEELINWAKEQGMSAVAVTDENSVQAFPEFFRLAKHAGIKPIFGAKITHTDFEGHSVCQASVLAKNQAGIKNLYRVISALRSDGKYNAIALDALWKNRDGLLIGSCGVNGMLYRALKENTDGKATAKIAGFYDYFEIQSFSGAKEEREINRKIVELGKQLDKPVAAVSDAQYIDGEDAICLDILRDFKECSHSRHSRLRTAEELLSELSYLGENTAGEVIYDNTAKIAERIGDVTPIPDSFFPPHLEGAEESLRQCATQKAHELYGNPLPELVAKRVEKELGWIRKNDSATLFVAARKLVENAAAHSYLTSARGAIGSSLVAFLTGISEINPLISHYRCPKCRHTEFVTDGSVKSGFDLPQKSCPVCKEKLVCDGHDIPAEVFFGLNGEKFPDIGLNVAPEHKPDAVRCLQTIFGKERVICAGAVTTISESRARRIAGKYLKEQKIGSREKERVMEKLVGVKESAGHRSGGVFIVPEGHEICDFTPVSTTEESQISTTHFHFRTLSDILVKFDIPCSKTIAFLKLAENFSGVFARDVPLRDEKVMNLIRSPETLDITAEAIRRKSGALGLPEFSCFSARKAAEDAKPHSFSDLIQISGLAHGTNAWEGNAQNMIADGVCALSDLIATRDDVMNELLRKGLDEKTAFEIMEIVRKGEAGTSLTEEHRQTMLSHGVPEWYVKSLQKTGYLFPKAHIVSYVINALRIGWYKVYHPTAFYAAYFTVYGTDEIAEVMLRGKDVVMERILQIQDKGGNISWQDEESYQVLRVAYEALDRGVRFLPANGSKTGTCLPEGGNIRLSFRKGNCTR